SNLDSNEMFYILLKDEDGMKAGSVVHRDVVECFRQNISHSDQRRNMTIIANTNNGLRVVGPKVNDTNKVIECMLDPGSQIVIMDHLAVAYLGICWDPAVKIQMQDSHGVLGLMEDLAQNVPFTFGDITIYLQVHI
ncbi:hypothetical protein GYMLUDRAFT_132311, partial [Collybiopsis luxurians FD-317 M1]